MAARIRKVFGNASSMESELPPEAQELRRQFREWDGSFSSPAKRLASIRDVCERIARAYQPEKIILFGSHAYGGADA